MIVSFFNAISSTSSSLFRPSLSITKLLLIALNISAGTDSCCDILLSFIQQHLLNGSGLILRGNKMDFVPRKIKMKWADKNNLFYKIVL